MLSFFLLQIGDGAKAPLCLAAYIEKSAFGSGLRWEQKGKLRLLKTVANTRAQGLKLLEEGYLGIVTDGVSLLLTTKPYWYSIN